MKVNINGRGIIPGIGTIPPVYNREMSENEILRLLNFQQFKVYSAASGILITKNNIKEMMNVDKEDAKKVVAPAKKPTEEVKPPVFQEAVEEHNVSGLVEDDQVETSVPVTEDTVIVTEENDESVEVDNDGVDEDTDSSDDVDYDAMDDKDNVPSYVQNNNYNHHNKKKNRH